MNSKSNKKKKKKNHRDFDFLKLDENDLRCICEWITAHEIRKYFKNEPYLFNKLKPGHRPGSISDNEAIRLVSKNIPNRHVSAFVMRFIREMQAEVFELSDELENDGHPYEEALMLAISENEQ